MTDASNHSPQRTIYASQFHSDWLAARAQATPHKLALIAGERRWIYAELDTAVSRAAAYLHQRGIRSGEFVAVLMPNSFAYVCLVHALARLGAVLVPLNTRLTPVELAWQVEHVAAKWLLVDDAHAPVVAKWPTFSGQLAIVNEALLLQDSSLAIENRPLAIDNLQSIIFTSGTSGQPKGAMLTFANHFWSATASSYRLGIQPDDLWLSVLPLYHVGGLAVIFRSCLYGTAVDLHPRFEIDAINHALDTRPITLISLVPTMLQRLLATRTHWPAALRLILLGGAAARPELIHQANALPRSGSVTIHHSHSAISPLVAPTYGLTEAGSQVSTILPAEAARKPGSVGKPLMWTRVRIVDDAGREPPPGEPGEIVVSGPTVMAGYFKQDAPTNGELHTGDIGYLDADGDLWLVQRRSDLIVSGGENIYPAEVEAVLRHHPAVTEACVVGVPHPEWGQQVAAMVALHPGETLTAEALQAFARTRLAGYKQPRRIRFVAELPHTASGKVARKAVQAQLAADEDAYA